MPWYVSTLESFAVTQVRPAPPERVDQRRAERERRARDAARADQSGRRAS